MVVYENEYNDYQRQQQLQGSKAQRLALSWSHLWLVTPVQAAKSMNIIYPPSGLKFKGGEVTRTAEDHRTETTLLWEQMAQPHTLEPAVTHGENPDLRKTDRFCCKLTQRPQNCGCKHLKEPGLNTQTPPCVPVHSSGTTIASSTLSVPVLLYNVPFTGRAKHKSNWVWSSLTTTGIYLPACHVFTSKTSCSPFDPLEKKRKPQTQRSTNTWNDKYCNSVMQKKK